MTTFGDLKQRVLRLLADPTGDDHDVDLLHDAVCAALDAILPWYAKHATTQFAGDGEQVQFALPSDVYEIDAVVDDATGEVIPPASLAPGIIRGPKMSGENDWIEYPHGSILLSKPLGSGETATVFYRGYWDKPSSGSDDNFTIDPFDRVKNGLALYAAAYAMLPSAVETAIVRQYGTREDSGNPEHNPLADRVEFLLRLFEMEMARLPIQTGGSRVQ